jgi:hypothetical protein
MPGFTKTTVGGVCSDQGPAAPSISSRTVTAARLEQWPGGALPVVHLHWTWAARLELVDHDTSSQTKLRALGLDD